MVNYLLVGAGTVIAAVGFFYYNKSKEQVRNLQITAFITYVGWSMLIIGGFKLLTPVFTSLFGDSGVTARTVLQVLLFLGGGELLLKPAFEDQIFKDEKGSNKKNSPNGKKKKK